jgi:hypothetical protein
VRVVCQNIKSILKVGALGLALTLSHEAAGQVPNADSTPSSRSASGGAGRPADTLLPAPVGHRQPKLSDLPENARRPSGADRSARELDDKLKICRGC